MAASENSSAVPATATGTTPPSVNFPSSIPVKDLEKTHPDYRPDLLRKYHDFFHGGDDFERNKKAYMRPRMIEQSNEAYKNARAACYHYNPTVAGVLDDLCGQALTSPPRIEVKDTNDARAAYWLTLNKNIDGEGRDLRAQAASRFTEICVHHRAYLTIDFPDSDDVYAASLDQQKKSGAVNARICALDAKDVDDWEYDEDGNLIWARSHVIEHLRDSMFGPRTRERHIWGFFTIDSVVEYSATKRIDEKSWPDKAVAIRSEIKRHSLGALPIIPIEVPADKWPMDQMFSTALALFNREGSREFALDSGALALPVYKGETKPANVTLTESGCIYVEPNGDFFWRSPDGAVYSALKDSAADLREALLNTLQAMAQKASNQSQNARQSGNAKVEDKAALKNLLSMLSAPIIDAYERALYLIATLRNEADDLAPKFVGMDKYDSQSIELEINRTNAYCMIPGQIPEAQLYSCQQLFKEVYPEAPPDVVKQIESAKPQAAIPQGGGDPSIRNSKTGSAAGFSSDQMRGQMTTITR